MNFGRCTALLGVTALATLLVAGRETAKNLEDGHGCSHGEAATLVTPEVDDTHIVVADGTSLEAPAYAGSLARVDAHDRTGNVALGGAPSFVFATALVTLASTGTTPDDVTPVPATTYPQVTCTGGGTCTGSTSCKHPTWCTLFFETCSSTFTCNGGVTCGTITCLGFTCKTTNTCKGSTCSGTTCTSSTTCSGSPTCNGYLTCSNTCQGTATCGGPSCPIDTADHADTLEDDDVASNSDP